MRQELRETLPWIIGAILVVLAVILFLWFSAEPDNPLPAVYDIL